jgi:tetratricopeptide (TPR) repeat protein
LGVLISATFALTLGAATSRADNPVPVARVNADDARQKPAQSGAVVAAPYSVSGKVLVRRAGQQQWSDVRVGTSFRVGDTVRTGEDGAVAFKFVDGTLVRLGRTSAITFSLVLPSGAPVVSHQQGRAYFFSRGATNEPEIRAPLVNAAIYGTELVVDIGTNQTTIDVLHGAVRATNSLGAANIAAGERVLARKNAPLEKSILVRPADSVQWMLRFPFVLNKGDIVSAPDKECSEKCVATIERIIEDSSRDETVLSALDRNGSKELVKTPRGATLKAIGFWRAGDFKAALAALKSVPDSAEPTSLSLRAVLRGFDLLTSGDKKGAREQLKIALDSNPNSVNAKLLESYILQSEGDFDKALTTISDTRSQHGDIPELFDREAELLLSAERAKEANRILAERADRFGSSALSETLRGFAALDRKEFEQAATYFDKAIASNSGDGLAYLGQSLLKARDRDYTAARESLSKAVQLEPANAAYRSYLGKLFFEDQNTPKSLEEFQAAIALDPHDPSPYLYRSFAHVANNNPVSALKDVESSISLNDGRAVYRSSLLVDRDLAVRSAGLSRVFTELGFTEAARIEAIKSITEDYANFSAHRLLGDSYQSIIDAEANLSEKRMADLMAPLSFNLFNSLGESATLGDYNALFDKKETRQAVRVDWNSNRDQIGGEILAVGKSDDFGYFTSYQPYYMSGSRHKAFSGANTFRGAFQWEPTADDRFILDNSITMIDSKDPDNANTSEDVTYGYARLGYNRRISSSVRWLTQGEFGRDRSTYRVDDTRSVGVVVPGAGDPLATDTDMRADTRDRVTRTSLSSQILYSSRYLDSVGGIEGTYADTSRRENSQARGFPDFPEYDFNGSVRSSSGSALTSGQAYEYLSFKLPRTANLTLGLAATSVEQELTQVPPYANGTHLDTAITPKTGLVLTPTKWLTARAAWFESLNRKAVLEDLSSLEPTLVGGINQRYNDLSGAFSRNLGFGLDLKESNTLYGGAQWVHRSVREAIGQVDELASFDGVNYTSLNPDSSGTYNSYSESDLLRGYVYSVLRPDTVLNFDSIGQIYNDKDNFAPGQINTQRHRVGVKHFIGKHLSLGLQATYRDQTSSLMEDPKGFWLLDAGVSYRFSEQRGRIFARVDNILDRDFTYDQSVGLEAPILPGRSFVVGVAYNFW